MYRYPLLHRCCSPSACVIIMQRYICNVSKQDATCVPPLTLHNPGSPCLDLPMLVTFFCFVLVICEQFSYWAPLGREGTSQTRLSCMSSSALLPTDADSLHSGGPRWVPQTALFQLDGLIWLQGGAQWCFWQWAARVNSWRPKPCPYSSVSRSSLTTTT